MAIYRRRWFVYTEMRWITLAVPCRHVLAYQGNRVTLSTQHAGLHRDAEWWITARASDLGEIGDDDVVQVGLFVITRLSCCSVSFVTYCQYTVARSSIHISQLSNIILLPRSSISLTQWFYFFALKMDVYSVSKHHVSYRFENICILLAFFTTFAVYFRVVIDIISL